MFVLLLAAALSLAMLLVVWLRTDAFIEYMRLFKLTYLFKVNEYLKFVSETNENISYKDFLINRYNNFFTRLITCPVCLSIWLGLILSVIFVSVKFSLAISFMGLLFYYSLARLVKHES